MRFNKLFLFFIVYKVSNTFKLKKNAFFIFLVLLSLPLALATTIQTGNVYASGTAVKITGTCDSPSIYVGLEYGYGSPAKTISVDQVTADTTKNYAVDYLPPQKGNYTVYAACQNEKAVFKTFCVGTDAECGVSGGPGPVSSTSSSSSGGGGGGGGGCQPSWSCGVWGYCNVSLKQVRVCSDKKGCEKSYAEARNCSKCGESWVCSKWSGCTSGEQVRACYDEHKCGSAGFKPGLRKSCQAAVAPGPQPVYVSPQIPVPPYTPPAESKLSALKPTRAATPFSFTKFWSDYQMYFFGLAALIAVIIILVVVIVHFAKPKQKVYNLGELKEWMVKEKQMGTNDTQIRQILSQNTGWNEEEVSQALRELNQRG